MVINAFAFVVVFAWFFSGNAFAQATPAATASGVSTVNKPIVIAHRGASGLRPEHTLAAYELALVQGADFIELDLVATGDGVLIARHENALAAVQLDEEGRIARDEDGAPLLRWETTDVAHRPQFADRLTVKQVDGRPVGGWFSEDFTLAEIRTLGARERMPELRQKNRLYNDREGVPTLDDVVDLVRRWETATGKRPGLYIELKHPTYFAAEGARLSGEPIKLDLPRLLLDALIEAHFTDADRLYLQCF
ncbi:MAG: glycerophosphodiester phosphodiesterase, partial [Gammaproteobacteria bacterium]